MAKGHLIEANNVLQKLAKINGTQLPSNFTDEMHRQIERGKLLNRHHSQKDPTVISLFKTSNMRLKTILITLNW